MPRLFFAALIPFFLAACAGAGADANAPANPDPSGFSPQPCWFDSPAGVRAECGILRAREDRDDSRNRRLMEIPVVRIFGANPANENSAGENSANENSAPAPPAVVLGGGGPGGEVFIETPDEIAFWNNLRRDILGEGGELILAEQRGAGLSRPALNCPEGDPAALLARPLSLREEARILREDLAECEERLAARTNLSAHTTAASADDFAELRRALEIPKWDLIGFSYGSRIAFEMLRRDPRGVRAAVMDAVVPPRRDPKFEGENISRIVDELAAQCAADPHCARRGGLRENLEAAAARLAKTPATLAARNPHNGEKLTVALNRRRFADLVFLNLYDEESAARLPKLAQQFARGEMKTDDSRFFVNRYLEFILDANFADALYLSIVCRESPRPKPNPAARFPEDEIGLARMELFSACDDFFTRLPRPSPPDAAGRFPVLMLAGEYDVAAPPDWAQNAAAKMKNARVVVFPTAHISLLTIPCARRTVREFLQNPTAPLNQCATKTRRLTFH